MAIYLGNLSTKQMADRLGIVMTDEDIAEMEDFRCHKADVEMGKWHCFDIPFVCACGGMEAAIKVRDIMQKYAFEIKTEFEIALAIDDRKEVRNEL